MTLTRSTADRLSPAELLDIWNRGFAGYYIDNSLDESKLAAHVRRSGVRMELSPVLLVDGRPAAFSLAAVGERSGATAAWIAGFGVAPEHRRQGLAGRVMSAQNELLDTAGVCETWLEVIDLNPARRVYAAAGFREVRMLLSFEGTPRSTAAAGRYERWDKSRLAAAYQAAHARSPAPPPWRRALAALERVMAELASVDVMVINDADGGVGAYAAVVAGPERASLLDAAAADPAASGRLLGALGDTFGDKPLRLIDEPESSPLVDALSAAGLKPFLTQIEMVRRTGV